MVIRMRRRDNSLILTLGTIDSRYAMHASPSFAPLIKYDRMRRIRCLRRCLCMTLLRSRILDGEQGRRNLLQQNLCSNYQVKSMILWRKRNFQMSRRLFFLLLLRP